MFVAWQWRGIGRRMAGAAPRRLEVPLTLDGSPEQRLADVMGAMSIPLFANRGTPLR